MDVDFLWNVAQHRQLESLEHATAETGETARRSASQLIDLQCSLERLALTCRAMWELLGERTSVSEDDLITRVREIDLRDGKADGRARAAARNCSRCSRVNNARRSRCLYCGAELEPGSAFNTI